MLSIYDDYPIHQGSAPVATPATTDRNFFERYWFNGYHKEGEYIFAISQSVAPNRRVMDGAFSVVLDGVQHSFHASCLNTPHRNRTVVGPFSVEVVSPLRELRVKLEPNDTGIACDLLFKARTAAVLEPRNKMEVDGVEIIDHSRLTQFGRWEGWIKVNNNHIELRREETYGVRDRSWGIRPIGEPHGGYPGSKIPQVYWLWAPLHFDECCTHFALFENSEGEQGKGTGGVVIRTHDDQEVPIESDCEAEHMASVSQKIWLKPGIRQVERAEVTLTPDNGQKRSISLEPLGQLIHLHGVGYMHQEWGHGMWKGENVHASESWVLDEVDLTDPRFVHQQHVCRATMGKQEGLGVLEQFFLGEHEPSGFVGLMDVKQS
ncbi:MAG: hypothetical protein ACR2PS_10605 [Pseudomonadales bacterium]